MNKIKGLLSKLSQELKDLMRKFPLTMSIIIFLTLLFTIIIDQNFSRNTREILEKVEMFCMIWIVGTFFTETFFVKKANKTLSYLLTGCISLFFVRCTFWELSSSVAIWLEKILGTYISVLVLISIYKAIKNSQLAFDQYLMNVFRDLFNMTVIYGILNIGFIFIVEIFNLLILDSTSSYGIIRVLILLFGLFYVPSILYSVSSINQKEVNSFIKGLVIYVLLPLVTIAMAIIYLYIAKILILKDMPKNVIFRILAGIFVVGFPVWNMASCYDEEKKWIEKVTKVLPYLYLPFIFLEMYAIGVRIGEFGVTPMRYVSCMFILLQVICFGLTFYKNKENLSASFIFVAILIFIAVLTPLGYENMSNLSQKKILERILPENIDFDELEENEKTKVRGAYQYLKGQQDSEKYMPTYLTKEIIQKINNYDVKYDYERYEYFSDNKELDLDISNYKKIRKVEEFSEKDTVIEVDTQNLDLGNFVNEIVQKNEANRKDAENYFEENNLVKISETEDFYIEDMSLSYKNDGEIDYFRVQGYLLER